MQCFCGGTMVQDFDEQSDHSDLVEYFTTFRQECNMCGAITMTEEDFKKSKESFEYSKEHHGVYTV
ncbi:hypothetical protein VPHD148_0099 [Vibrio phage D148]